MILYQWYSRTILIMVVGSLCWLLEKIKHSPNSQEKKSDKQLINNYRTVSLLSICIKILERIIVDSIFQIIAKNKFLNVNQSGFYPIDSCDYQQLSSVYNIHTGFDQNPPLKVRSSFLDNSKAFDKGWQ